MIISGQCGRARGRPLTAACPGGTTRPAPSFLLPFVRDRTRHTTQCLPSEEPTQIILDGHTACLTAKA